MGSTGGGGRKGVVGEGVQNIKKGGGRGEGSGEGGGELDQSKGGGGGQN